MVIGYVGLYKVSYLITQNIGRICNLFPEFLLVIIHQFVSTGSTAAMAASGGQPMELSSPDLQFMIREHMIENSNEVIGHDVDNGFINCGEQMHLRWNSQRGRIYIDGSHLTHNLELGDEIMIDNRAPPLPMFIK